MIFGGNRRAVLAGGWAKPVSEDVLSSPGPVRVNDVLGYRSVAPGAVTQINPWDLFADTLSGNYNCLGISAAISTIPENGIMGVDGQMRVGKVADPDDAAKRAYYLRLDQGDASSVADGLKQRLEFSDSTVSRCLFRGVPYWLAFSFRVPSLWKQADAVLTDSVEASADETLLFQIHEAADSFDVPSNPSMVMIVAGGNAGTPQNATQRLTIRSNPNLVSEGSSQSIVREVWNEQDYPADVWQHWVFNLMLHWDINAGPFTRAWRRIGNGPIVQMLADSQPNHYNNTEHQPYVKTGMYYYAHAWTGGLTSRVMHHKGLYSWLHREGMTAAAAFDFLNSI